MAEDKSFIDFKLCKPVIRGIKDMEWMVPTPIQEKAIPEILRGVDVCATAITGSGKSGAFLIPLIHRLFPYRGRPGPKAVVITPTRELAQQLFTVFQVLASHANVTAATVVGGISAEEQAAKLDPVPDVIIATPGRLLDVVTNNKIINLGHVQMLILDECDRLLARSFEAELNAITSRLPEEHQTLLFTATLSDQVSKITHRFQKDAVRLTIDLFFEMSPNLTQQFVKVKNDDARTVCLVALCQNLCNRRTLVFLPTKVLAHKMTLLLKHCGIVAAELHASLPQPERTAAVAKFSSGEVGILLASDIAARGLDIRNVDYVINYSVPNEIERYIHRVGRTARAGRSGTSITFFGEPHEKHLFKRISKNFADKTQVLEIPRELKEKARKHIIAYQAIVEKAIEKEQQDKEERARIQAEKKLSALLDVEEEVFPLMDKKKHR